MRTSENAQKAKFALTEFSEVALGQRDDVRLLAMTNVHYARIGDVWNHSYWGCAELSLCI